MFVYNKEDIGEKIVEYVKKAEKNGYCEVSENDVAVTAKAGRRLRFSIMVNGIMFQAKTLKIMQKKSGHDHLFIDDNAINLEMFTLMDKLHIEMEAI